MIAALFVLALQDTSRLTLVRAVERALAQYPAVGAARALVDRAAAERGEAGSQRLPRLIVEGSLTRFEEPMLVYPLHGFPTVPAPGSIVPTFDRTLVQGSAFLSWTVYDFGQRSSRLRAATELGRGSEAALTATEQAVAARTAGAYLRVLTVGEVLAAQSQRLAALTAEARRVRQLLAEGKAARIEVLRVDAEAARARSDSIATASQLEVAERELATLTGMERVRAAALDPVPIRDTAVPEPDRAELLERAAAFSPELAEARIRLSSARAAEAAARAARLPELRLTAGIVDRGRASGNFQAEWQAGLGVSYALWTGGGRASQIRRAAAETRAAAEQVRLAEQSLEQSLDRALAALREARARVVALRAAAEQSEEVARIERTALEIGTATQNEYLEAEANLLRTRAQLIEARNGELVALVELARLTGELDPEWFRRIGAEGQGSGVGAQGTGTRVLR
ncbi:MAG TPA: TolC family protein [Gemmatimonadales bacterium]|nr:TolC family protein [Gemmatimonadales bacterium]